MWSSLLAQEWGALQWQLVERGGIANLEGADWLEKQKNLIHWGLELWWSDKVLSLDKMSRPHPLILFHICLSILVVLVPHLIRVHSYVKNSNEFILVGMFVMCQIFQRAIEDWACSRLLRMTWTDWGTPEHFLPQEVGGNNKKYFSRLLARKCWNVTSHQRGAYLCVFNDLPKTSIRAWPEPTSALSVLSL